VFGVGVGQDGERVPLGQSAEGYKGPSLARRFGGQSEAYRTQVPGWWPRLRAGDPHQ
jgi:hypothetical protein